MQRVEKSYTGSKEIRTPKELGREVQRALSANEQVGEFEYDIDERRRLLREEVAHHIPASHRPVRIVGLLGRDENGEYDRSTVAIKHYGATPREELASAEAPAVFDKRFQQEPSQEDLKTARKAKKKLFGIF